MLAERLAMLFKPEKVNLFRVNQYEHNLFHVCTSAIFNCKYIYL